MAGGLMLLPFLAGCSGGVLEPQGPIASAQRLLLINSTAIMLVVVIPVIVATLAFAWWYRSSNARANRGTDESYEERIEFVVWSIPALTVILLGGVIWIGSHQLDPRRRFPGNPTRCAWTSWRSIGNGCSSTPISASPPSISWSSRQEPRSSFGSPRRR